jgi:hypothetical protein
LKHIVIAGLDPAIHPSGMAPQARGGRISVAAIAIDREPQVGRGLLFLISRIRLIEPRESFHTTSNVTGMRSNVAMISRQGRSGSASESLADKARPLIKNRHIDPGEGLAFGHQPVGFHGLADAARGAEDDAATDRFQDVVDRTIRA